MDLAELSSEQFNAIGASHLPGYLGIDITHVSHGEVMASWKWPRTCWHPTAICTPDQW